MRAVGRSAHEDRVRAWCGWPYAEPLWRFVMSRRELAAAIFVLAVPGSGTAVRAQTGRPRAQHADCLPASSVWRMASPRSNESLYDLIIVGGTPAGLMAAIAAARYGRDRPQASRRRS